MIQAFYNKLSEQEKKIFYGAVLFIVMAFFDMLFLRPVMNRLEALDKEIQEKTNSLKRDIRFLTYRDHILKEEEEFRKFQTDEKQPEEEIIARFLKTIELLATDSKINLVKLNPAEVAPKKGYIQYHANLECDGPLTNVIQFMHKIDTTDNLLRVVKVSMMGNKARVEDVNASIKIAKLVIDPKTIGNYEDASEEEDVEMDVPAQGQTLQPENQEVKPDVETKLESQGQGDAEGQLPGDKGQAEKDGKEPEEKTGGGAGVKKDAPEAKEEPLIPEAVPPAKKGWKFDNIVDLWYKFIGKEKKPDIPKKKIEKDPAYLEDWKDRKNLWERLLGSDDKNKQTQ